MKHVVITIGREYGSGGRLIAKKLSEELGITFYDKELIAAVAKKTGFSENFIRDTEHQRPTNSFLYDLYTAVQTPSVPDQVFVAQAKVIKEAAAKESCVIVGRCADYILRDDPCLLSVFVHAPLDERVRRARVEYGVEQANLENFVIRQDKARASYYPVGTEPGVRSVRQQHPRHRRLRDDHQGRRPGNSWGVRPCPTCPSSAIPGMRRPDGLRWSG